MPSRFILTVLAYVLGISGFIGSIYAGYSHIKHIGYEEAKVVYEEKINTLEEERKKRLASIESLATQLVADGQKNKEDVDKSLQSILIATKAKPLVVVKNGECTPSQTFSDSLDAINKRVNQNVKGK